MALTWQIRFEICNIYFTSLFQVLACGLVPLTVTLLVVQKIWPIEFEKYNKRRKMRNDNYFVTIQINNVYWNDYF